MLLNSENETQFGKQNGTEIWSNKSVMRIPTAGFLTAQ